MQTLAAQGIYFTRARVPSDNPARHTSRPRMVGHVADDAEVVRDEQNRHATSRCLSSLNKSRICASIVTSSAGMVSSSATSNFGSLASAMRRSIRAAACPPDILERIIFDARFRRGNALTSFSNRMTSGVVFAFFRLVQLERFLDLVAGCEKRDSADAPGSNDEKRS